MRTPQIARPVRIDVPKLPSLDGANAIACIAYAKICKCHTKKDETCLLSTGQNRVHGGWFKRFRIIPSPQKVWEAAGKNPPSTLLFLIFSTSFSHYLHQHRTALDVGIFEELRLNTLHRFIKNNNKKILGFSQAFHHTDTSLYLLSLALALSIHNKL